jgi:Stage II sporulation protein E (SpoIIE)
MWMRKRSLCTSLLFCLATIAVSAANTAVAQNSFPVAPTVSGTQQVALGNSALALMGPWKFRLGNNMAWAHPSFDDSGWEDYTLKSQGLAQSIMDPYKGLEPGWAGHGHRGSWGFGWYRTRVNLGQTDGQVNLLLPYINSAYNVYWDGHRLGGFGDLERHVSYVARKKLFAIPAALSGPGEHALAIQVWDEPSQALQSSRDDGGLRGAPLLVAAPIAGQLQSLADRSRVLWAIYDVGPDLMICEVGFFVLILFVLDRRRLEYLWIALTLLCFFVPDVTIFLATLTEHFSYRAYAIVFEIFSNTLMSLFGLLAAIWLMGLQRKRWLLRLVFAAWSPYFLFSIATEINLHFAFFSRQFLQWNLPIFLIAFGCSILILLYVAIVGIRTRGREAWIDLSPGLLLFGFFLMLFATGQLRVRPSLSQALYIFFIILIPLSVVAIVLRRFLRQWREHRRVEEEMQQAQAVQALLVPENLPQTPGYRIAGTYLPASHVGGDFYQVLLMPDGGLIAVLGDVSGKGLQAAMVVSMAVGAVRAIVKETSQPEEILSRLNRELIGNLKSGFVTCICACFDDTGTVTVANAGHLPPWVNGKEMPMDGALPLGMLAGAEYERHSFHLDDGDSLVLMSDGVVEARSGKDGRLYGFDGLAALLAARPSAEEIARTAQRFGQEDDISVLEICRVSVAEPAIV